MKIAFHTLGCKVNRYETEILAGLFAAAGYELVSAEQEADVYVVNSCTVTAEGDRKTRQLLRRFAAQNPAAKLVLTGCFPQAFPEAAAQLPEADVITGARGRAKLVEQVGRCLATGARIVEITPHERGEAFEEMRTETFTGHTRAFVKIEDGCDRRCTYCIIPTARGFVRSKPLAELTAELTALAVAGYLEVVLVGINLPSYGRDLGLRLMDAVEAACAVEGIARVRLGSLEPELLTEEDIARMVRQPKLCPQFHLSLQSGCDATLRRMNRQYDTAAYARIVRDLRAAFPACAITTDLMVGFPGEDDAEFEASLAFVRKIGFAQAHIFAYSRRPGTRAADMPQQISNAVKAQRSASMGAAARAGQAAFLAAQVGRTVQVLFEQRMVEGLREGHTPDYTPVRAALARNMRGEIVPIRITEAHADYLVGEPVLYESPIENFVFIPAAMGGDGGIRHR